MHASREEITAALRQVGNGAGQQRLVSLAHDAIRDSGCGPWADPTRIAIGLRFGVRALTRVEYRASVDGRVISYAWHADDRERGLNAFLGVSLARLGELEMIATPSDVMCFAGYLAIHERMDAARALELQRHLPDWFITAHCRIRSAGLTSGVLRLAYSR